MSNERILIVEDEAIVATDLEILIKTLGYQVVGVAATGEAAIRLTHEVSPDLVLMDIRLKGDMDGIDAAEHITATLNIPIVYLTAYADEKTLERAKTTMPYGYILKPFEEKSIRTTLELAFYKFNMESMMMTLEAWHGTALRSLADPVVALNTRGRVTFLNASAQTHFGWALADVYGKTLEEVYHFTVPSYGVALKVHVSTKSATAVWWVCGMAPIIEKNGQTSGSILVFHSPD